MALHTSGETQVRPIKKPPKASGPTSPTRGRHQKQKEHTLQLVKRQPQTERQTNWGDRKNVLAKKQVKNPQKQLNEGDIQSTRKRIQHNARMIQLLSQKEVQIKKLQEMFNKELEDLKNKDE